MKIKITGANGYLGNLISKKLSANGHEVSGVNRTFLYGPLENLKNEIRNSDVIINLAGVSILKRWTKRNKEEIYKSRVNTTGNLVSAINQLPEIERPKKFISASAIGIYKTGEIHTEESRAFDEGFVGKVVKDWEDVLEDLPDGIQKNIFRIGLVLGRNSKTIKNLLIPFRLGLGGTIGKGKQAFPYIHETDLVNAFVWVVEEYRKSNVFNLVAPESISNKMLTKTLSKKLNRPAFLPVPPFVLKLIYGEASVLLLESPVVNPKAMLDNGFEFEFSTIDSALSDIIS